MKPKAGESNLRPYAEETEIHREDMKFPKPLSGVSGRVENADHSLMAGGTGLSHPIPDRECPEEGG